MGYLKGVGFYLNLREVRASSDCYVMQYSNTHSNRLSNIQLGLVMIALFLLLDSCAVLNLAAVVLVATL